MVGSQARCDFTRTSTQTTGESLTLKPRVGTQTVNQLKNAPLMTAFAPFVLVFMSFTFTWPVMLHL